MLPLLALLACAAPEYGLSADVAPPDAPGGSTAPPAVQAQPGAPDEAMPVAAPPVVSRPDGSASSTWTVGEGRRDAFSLGPAAATPLVDFLFVVDPSSSMRRVVEQLQAGFAGLAHRGAFPARARVAVTGTTPAEPDGARRPHPAVHHRGDARWIPGFQALVSSRAIARWRNRADPEQAARFTAPGCAPWFDPGEVDATGTPCLVAHTQPALVTVWVEDGLVALRQLVERAPGPLFRTGASVNVVLVTDAVGPGFVPAPEDFQAEAWRDELDDLRPDYDELLELVLARQELAGFRVHALLPRTGCGEAIARQLPDGVEPDEVEVARASGGVVADLCTTTDYAAVVEEVVASGRRVQRPVVALSAPAEQVRTVRVGGLPVRWRLTEDGRAVVLDALPAGDAPVEVDYLPRRGR